MKSKRRRNLQLEIGGIIRNEMNNYLFYTNPKVMLLFSASVPPPLPESSLGGLLDSPFFLYHSAPSPPLTHLLYPVFP